MINAITDRFNQPGFRIYAHLESLLLKSISRGPVEDHLDAIKHTYTSDFCYPSLQIQLQTFEANYGENLRAGNGQVTLKDIIATLLNLTIDEKLLFSELCKLIKMIIVLPATIATSERSFSAMRRVKSYLRSTMNQDRLNFLMVLHIHAHLTDKINLVEVANEFVSNSERSPPVFVW